MNNITIYTDGSSRGNPGQGGWGAILIFNDKVTELGGREDMTTNNRMELMAAIEALSKIPAGSDVTVYADSQYVIKGITEWIFGWEKNAWKNSQKKLVLNRDLWERLKKETVGKKIQWKYVAGHSENVGNERCDVIATSFADNLDPNLFNGDKGDYLLKI